jgi:hypothetical protein
MIMKKTLIAILFMVVSLLSAEKTVASDPDPGTLRAGFSRTDITPEIPVKLYGYASRKTYSEGVHDPLSARAVVLK